VKEKEDIQMFEKHISNNKYIVMEIVDMSTLLTSITFATSTRDRSGTIVKPWVTFGSPLGPISYHIHILYTFEIDLQIGSSKLELKCCT